MDFSHVAFYTAPLGRREAIILIYGTLKSIQKWPNYRGMSGFQTLESTGEWLNAHAARQIITGQMEHSAPVILTYRKSKSVKNCYTAENRFYPSPLTWGRLSAFNTVSNIILVLNSHAC
jgi:hypothetical protein